jgi:zinc protease
MLTRGTSERSRQQIRDDLDRMKAQLRVFGTPSMVQARLEVPREHLADALRLLAEALRRPSFPESELALLAEEEVARLEESLQDPIRKGFVALQRHLDDYPPGDPRHVATAQEAIAATREVTAEDLRAFHRDFYGASAARIAAVGDFDPAALEPLVAELFGDWESLRPFVRIPTPYVERTALAEVIATPDKESAVFAAGARIALQDDDPDYPALVMGNFLTGGGFISSRLADRLRQQDGLCYGVGSSFDASSWEPNATFFGFAIYAPQNAARLEAGFREEIAKVLAGGFTPEEVAAGQQGWLQQRKVSRVQEDELAGRLAALEHLGRTLDWDGDLESAVAALTPEQIHAAMKKHLSLEAMSMVKAGDFAEAAAGEAAAAPPVP